jgi:hypothetical protein
MFDDHRLLDPTAGTGRGPSDGVGTGRRARWAAGIAACALAACCLPATAAAAASAPPAGTSLAPVSLPHGLGLVPAPSPAASPGTIAKVAVAAAALPASVDLTPYAMPVGNQGQVGSCAAWATDYTALGYWESRQGIAGGGLEPMYTYSQVTGGVDEGSSIEGNLQVDEHGIDTQSDYWQGNFDFSDMPTAAEKAQAVNWKLSSFSDLPIVTSSSSTVTQQSIETALAAGDPVVIGIPVYDNFFYVTRANNGLYAGPSGGFDGYHAITALGYNSSGLVIENSWGAGWGNSGYATLSWSFVNADVFDAVSVGPLSTGQPVGTTAPAVTGSGREGQVLTASSGSWSPAATSYAYQWQRAANGSNNWSTIPGATAATYTPGVADLGERLRVSVTATNSKGQGANSSAQFGPITTGAPAVTTAPSITGTLRVGQALTAAAGSWSPAATSYTYQWQRSTNSGSTWSNITGATGSTYQTAAGDVNADERVVVTASNSYGTTTATSAQAGPVSGEPYNTVTPAITGTAVRGSTLTAGTGTWSPAGTSYTYQWQRSSNSGVSWSNIASATSASDTLGVSDENTELRVVVKAVNPYGTVAATSAASGSVKSSPPVPSATPGLSGTATVGHQLTATTGTWSGVGNVYSYQWQHESGSTWSSISSATSSTYTLARGDAGDHVRVLVTATNPDGTAGEASAVTASVTS